MKRSKLLGLALTSIVALAAVFSAPAFALPELLGQAPNAEFTGKNTAENPTLETTKEEKIVCKEAAEEGIQETNTLGPFHIHFTGCKSSGFACNTSGDGSGVILTLGTFHYVYDHLGSGSELGIAILFLPEEQTIKCTALVTLKVKGSVLCLVSESFTFETTHNFTCSESKGVPSETTWWNDEGGEQHAKLETSKNGGSFIESAEATSASFTFGSRVSFKVPDVTVTPKPVHFAGANTTQDIEVNAISTGKYKILEQSITDDINNRFSFVGGTSSCLNTKLAKPAEAGAPEKCLLLVKATGLANGEDAKLVTKYEREPAVYQTTYYDTLEW